MQTLVTEFTDEWEPHGLTQKETGRILQVMMQWHLRNYVRLYLKLWGSPQNLATFHKDIDEALDKMETEGVCFLKTIPSSGTYMFKQISCYLDTEYWKKCPHFLCQINFPCCDSCPVEQEEETKEQEENSSQAISNEHNVTIIHYSPSETNKK